MRTETAKRILKQTPQEIKDKVREETDKYVKGMKKYKNFLFVGNDINSVIADVSDGYIKGFDKDEEKRIKLPHGNYTLLGIVAECIDSPYQEEFSKEIVSYLEPREGYGGYKDYTLDAWAHYLDTAVKSMKTLIERLDLKPNDFILRDEERR